MVVFGPGVCRGSAGNAEQNIDGPENTIAAGKKKGESINGKSKEIDRIFIDSGNDFDHAANADSGGRG